MPEVSLLQEKLGFINWQNQNEYYFAFKKVENWSQEEVLAWFQIFERNDYDDYSAFAWELIGLAEKHLNEAGREELRKIDNYWAYVASLD